MTRCRPTAALLLGLAAGEPAVVRRISVPITLTAVRCADVVVVGRIINYRIVREEAFRRRMPSKPRLADEMRPRIV